MSITALKVIVSGTTYGFDAEYTYREPYELRGRFKPGQRVIVPFGGGNVRHIGVVTRVYEREDEEGIKEVRSIVDDEPLINPELLDLVFWLRDNTFCTYFEAFRTIVPAGFAISVTDRYCLSNQRPDSESVLTDDEKDLYERLSRAADRKEFSEITDSADKKLLLSLCDKGLLEREDIIKRRVGDETVTMIRLSREYFENQVEHGMTQKQRLIEQFISECGSASVKEALYFTGATKTVISNMIKKGILEEYKYETFRTPEIEGRGLKPDEITLSDEQQKAYDGIMSMIMQNKPAGALLHGVTGSGKTAVFIKLIDSVIKSGRTAIMLVPEISLTPQLVGKFKAAFGETVAVIHSALSLGQRMDEYKRAKNGSAKIVIGTRSAVFAPLENIGIIIMDEEGEASYKSESSPRYHARDVAIKRCGTHKCVLLTASATPSLETYYYAKSGRFALFELKTRYNRSQLPQVVVADMALEAEQGNKSPFCADLIRAMRENLENKKQSIILLNRRGYNTHAICHSCREAIKCPNCLLPLTLHKANSRLMCHCCGYSVKFDGKCPKCGSESVTALGLGTQLIEEEIKNLFPDARVLRMDADSTSSRITYDEKFRSFENGEYDIMIGTQMIAKGLDFPDVSLVGVISLDNSLFAGSYRSFERTFSLLTQVVGRGGRGSERGLAFIQTYLPEHYVIALASEQDYEGFYSQEIALRRELIYPPFCDLMSVIFSSPLESEAIKAASAFLEIMREGVDKEKVTFPLRVLGPAKIGVGRQNGRYRCGLTLKCRNSSKFREFMSALLIRAYKDKRFKNIRITADMNPESIN